MSRNLRLLIELVSAGSFYYLFGVLFLRPPGNQAFTSIIPAVHGVVLIISVALAVFALRRYFRSAPESAHKISDEELSQRETAARKHLASVYGEPGQEHSVTLFVSHHLAEIGADYWMKHTGIPDPDPGQVLGVLELRYDPEEEGIDILDFTLPDGATNYVLSIEFDDLGNIVGVAMEG